GRAPPQGELPPAWLKEAHVFDAPDFDDSWTPAEIDEHFALRFRAFDDGRLHGDATPVNIYHPRVVERVARYNPRMRWIVLLRDPVERAISHYFMESGRGNEHRSLLGALLAEPGRLAGSFDDFSRDAPWRRASYADRSRYARQLAVLFSHFARNQVLLLRSRGLADAPLDVVRRVFEFLELEQPRDVPVPGRAFEGGYSPPPSWSPGRLLLRWYLRREAQRLRASYGFTLDSR